MLDVLPALAHRYGDMSSAAAAEWYSEVLKRIFDDDGADVQATNPFDDTEAQALIRANAGTLFGSDAAPQVFLVFANDFLDRNVHAAGRDTVRQNAEHGKREARFARIPSGVHTCPFCAMLASRGAVYASERTALGETKNHYHNNCNCEAVPVFGDPQDVRDLKLEGYDYDRYDKMYRNARDLLANPEQMDDAMARKLLGPDATAADLRARVENVNAFRGRRTVYPPGSPNNMNSLSVLMKLQNPEFFKS